MVTNSRQYSAFSCVRQPFFESFFGKPLHPCSALLSAYSANWAGKGVNRYGRKVVIGGLSMAIFGLLSSVAVVLLHEYLDLSICKMTIAAIIKRFPAPLH